MHGKLSTKMKLLKQTHTKTNVNVGASGNDQEPG